MTDKFKNEFPGSVTENSQSADTNRDFLDIFVCGKVKAVLYNTESRRSVSLSRIIVFILYKDNPKVSFREGLVPRY